VKLSLALLHAGVFVNAAVYPSVPIDGARLRFFVTAQHTEDMIARACEAVVKAFSENP
jgi:myxalamid-type polyketide synthase MxaB